MSEFELPNFDFGREDEGQNESSPSRIQWDVSSDRPFQSATIDPDEAEQLTSRKMLSDDNVLDPETQLLAKFGSGEGRRRARRTESESDTVNENKSGLKKAKRAITAIGVEHFDSFDLENTRIQSNEALNNQLETELEYLITGKEVPATRPLESQQQQLLQQNHDQPNLSLDSFDQISDSELMKVIGSSQKVNSGLTDSDDSLDSDLDWESILAMDNSERSVSCAANVKYQHLTNNLTVIRGNVSQVENLADKAVIVVQSESGASCTAILTGNWLDSVPEVGMIVNIVSKIKNSDTFLVDDRANMLVLEPDTMVSCTAISESFWCDRKTVLKTWIRGSGDTNEAMVYGSIIHELFQACLVKGVVSESYIRNMIFEKVEEYMQHFFLCSVTRLEAFDYLEGKIKSLCNWGEKYFKSTPTEPINDARGAGSDILSISKVIDIEEDLWSSIYGIRGYVDTTVEITVRSSNGLVKYLAPMEIKTSVKPKLSFSHQAQTILYTLLMRERYNRDVDFGLLVYTETGEMTKVPTREFELRDLIIARNQLAVYFKRKERLPETIDNPLKCLKCDFLQYCFTFRAVEIHNDMTGDQLKKLKGSDAMSSAYTELTSSLTQKHVLFYNSWLRRLEKEEQTAVSLTKEIWTLLGNDREKLFRCFAGLKIVKLKQKIISDTDTLFIYTFERDKELDIEKTEIDVGDHIVISDENGSIFLTSGYVTELEKNHVVVQVTKRISEFNHEYRIDDPKSTFRIDKNEFVHSMSIPRNNLTVMFMKNTSGNRFVRFIVDGKNPQFIKNYLYTPVTLKLNSDQKNALDLALGAQDFAIIKGMPGTGKTRVVTALIEQLVKRKKSILFTSNTNSVVDETVLAVAELGIEILRLGSRVSNSKVKKYTPAGANIESEDDINKVYMDRPVIATTTLGITHWIFTRRPLYDYCIIDESSHTSLPTTLGPVNLAEKFILIGDEMDDPKAVESSLYGTLIKNPRFNTKAIFTLDTQYRMCQEITDILNHTFLSSNEKLRCGSKEIAEKSLGIKSETAFRFHSLRWLYKILKDS